MQADSQIEGLFAAFDLVRAALPVVILLALVPLVWLFAQTYIERGIGRLRPHAKVSTIADEQVLTTAYLWLRIFSWYTIVVFGIGLVALVDHEPTQQVRRALVLNPYWGLQAHYGILSTVLLLWGIISVIIEVSHRFMAFLSNSLPALKPRHALSPRAAFTIEIFIKYFLISLGALVTFVAAVAATRTIFGAPITESLTAGITSFLATNSNKIAFLALFLFVSLFVWRLIGIFIDDFGAKATHLDPKIISLAKRTFSGGFLFLVTLILLFSLMGLAGLSNEGFLMVGVLLTFLVLGVAIASTSSLRNVFSGMVLLYERPFHEGDRVKILGDIICDVQDIGLLVTKARTLRGEVITIPNNRILEHPVVNFSGSGDYAVSLVVAVPRRVGFFAVSELLTRAALATPGIIHAITPEVFAVGLEADNIVYDLQAYTESAQQARRLKSTLLYNIEHIFHEAEIPVVGSADDSAEIGQVHSVQQLEHHDRLDLPAEPNVPIAPGSAPAVRAEGGSVSRS